MAAYASTQIELANDPVRDALNPDNVTFTLVGGVAEQQRLWNMQRGCFDALTAADCEEMTRLLDVTG